VQPQNIALTVTPDSPVADLWPKLGIALTELLQKRGRFRVADLAPRNQDDLLLLYRLGKANLRKIQALLEQLEPHADGAWRERIDRALRLIASRSHTRGAARVSSTTTDQALPDFHKIGGPIPPGHQNRRSPRHARPGSVIPAELGGLHRFPYTFNPLLRACDEPCFRAMGCRSARSRHCLEGSGEGGRTPPGGR